MTRQQANRDDESDWIMASDAMPVCLHGDRMAFMHACTLSADPMPSVELVQSEWSGNSWDGASIPRLFWSIIGHPLTSDFRWASYWHDRLCEQSRTWGERRLADAVLLVLLQQAGVGYLRRTAMWLAVRFYAWTVWSWRRRR